MKSESSKHTMMEWCQTGLGSGQASSSLQEVATQACGWKGNGKISGKEKIPNSLILLLMFQGSRKQRKVDSEDTGNLSHGEEA